MGTVVLTDHAVILCGRIPELDICTGTGGRRRHPAGEQGCEHGEYGKKSCHKSLQFLFHYLFPPDFKSHFRHKKSGKI